MKRGTFATAIGSHSLSWLITLLVTTAASRSAESAKISIPPAAEIISRLQPSHPRLLASQAEFAKLKRRIDSDPQLQSWYTVLRKQADEILSAPASRYEIPDGLRLLATSRRVVDRVYTLALVHQLERDSRHAERAWQELAAAAEFPDWNPKHFLDTAEMTHAFAIGYDWLFDTWTPVQREILHQAIVQKGLRPALALYQAQRGWPKARHNWNQVCNGGIAIGALALGDGEPELAGEILHAALESIQLAMDEFAPDGAWKEGPGYWNYATSYNVLLLAALESALHSEFGLAKINGFAKTGLFPLYLTGPLGRTFNYADGGDRTIRAPQLFWLARTFQQPVFSWLQRQSATPTALDLIWYQPPTRGPKAASLPLDNYFRGAEVVTLRSEWENSKALFVGFKAGDNKANHSHLDVGSFVFDALGVRWAVDLGADNYNLPGFFGKQRWTYYRLRAEGQNTLLINPTDAPDQDPAAATRIIRFQSKPERAFAIADLTPAYGKHARKVWRGITLLDRNKVLIQDEIDADKLADIWWFMHTPAVLKIESDGRTATLQQVGATLRAEILSPTGAAFRMMNAQPLPGSPHPEGQAANEEIKKLAIHLENAKTSTIAVLLTPEILPTQHQRASVKLTTLSDW
jgi:hypothetical protein